MSNMLQVLSMMATPAAILLVLRRYVVRQNRAATIAEQNGVTPPQ
jgi:hypothetical protein